MSDNRDDKLLMALGEIRGELSGIRTQIVESNAATHRRIDDLAESVRQQTSALNRRIDDHQEDTDKRFQSLEGRVSQLEQADGNARRTAIISGGGTSAVVSAAVEFIRQVVS